MGGIKPKGKNAYIVCMCDKAEPAWIFESKLRQDPQLACNKCETKWSTIRLRRHCHVYTAYENKTGKGQRRASHSVDRNWRGSWSWWEGTNKNSGGNNSSSSGVQRVGDEKTHEIIDLMAQGLNSRQVLEALEKKEQAAEEARQRQKEIVLAGMEEFRLPELEQPAPCMGESRAAVLRKPSWTIMCPAPEL